MKCFCLCFIFFSCVLNAQIKDRWIDKNEDENYTARHECSFVQAGDKFIMFGGRESAQKLDIYDFKTNTWTQAKNLAPKEFNHFQATFYKGFVWIIGAFKTNTFPREIPEENIWLYFPPTDTWIKGPEIPKNRRRGGAGLVVYNDTFYLIGGNTMGHNGGYVNWFDEYNPKTNTWTVLENASQARDHFSAAVINNKLYAVAGRQSGGEGGVFAPLVNVVDVYDFNTKTWSVLKENIPTPRAAPSIAVFNNELLVMGGEGTQKGPAYNIVEAYNPKTGKWTKKANMHHPRHGTQAIRSGKGIYIAAGSPKRGGGRQLNMEVYNEDKPSGNKLTASHLTAPKKVKIAKGTSTLFKIKNEGGNTGSFITSVKLIGKDTSAFKIESNLNFILIDANSDFMLKVKHLSENKNNKAYLEITYNGNNKKIIKLLCK
ncbi:galactose oxidase [Seonamhaeicola sp. NFXS20]|uniref:Kelch repeat-containing protein n=1 Tax=Seonamhaeicola sp. NFXS20 TaxID=2816959 RepID=UPI003B8C1E35